MKSLKVTFDLTVDEAKLPEATDSVLGPLYAAADELFDIVSDLEQLPDWVFSVDGSEPGELSD